MRGESPVNRPGSIYALPSFFGSRSPDIRRAAVINGQRIVSDVALGAASATFRRALCISTAMRLDLIERELLETILDADGLSAILRALADMCGDKARCTRAIHSDEVTAQSWERIAIYLDEVAGTETVRDCPLP